MLGKLQKRYDLYVARSVLKDAIDPNDPLYDRLLHDKGEIAGLIRLMRECVKFLKSSGESLNKKSICRQIVADFYPKKDKLDFNVCTGFAITGYQEMIEKHVTGYRILLNTPTTRDQYSAIILERFQPIANSQHVELENTLVFTWEGWEGLSAFLEAVVSGEEVSSEIRVIDRDNIAVVQQQGCIFAEIFVVEDETVVIGQGWVSLNGDSRLIEFKSFFKLARDDDTISQFLNQMQESEGGLRFKYTYEMLEALEIVLDMEENSKYLLQINFQIRMIKESFIWLEENGRNITSLKSWLERLEKKLIKI